MAGKKKKLGKKPKGPNKGPAGQGQNGGDDVSAMDDVILAQVIAGSKEEANNAGIASLEESVLSKAIAASLQSANANNTNNNTPTPTTAHDGTAGDIDTAPKPPTEEENNDTLLKDTLGDDDDQAQFAAGIEKCPHLKEAVKLPRIRKTLTATHPVPADLDHCHGCRDQHTKLTNIAQQLGVSLSLLALSGPIDDLLEPMPLDALSLCLTCSEINCGRLFQKHALKHHDKVTNNHPLVMNLGSMDVWCYECDDQVVTSKDKNPILQECQTLLARTLQAKQAKAREGLLAQSRKGKGNKDSKIKVYAPGLQNLGNTCFFNSVIQVLVETKSLREILSDSNHASNSISATTRTGLGPLTTTFKDFLFTMWKQQGGTVTPRDLFTQIAKKWKIFRGFREQDSQELMRHLLEGIRQEEADLIKKRLAEEEQQQQKQAGGDTKEVTSPPKYVPFIDTCFSGKLVSVIVCDACKKCSYAYEDYYDLSLPIKGAPVSIGSGSLMDRLRAKSRAAGFELSRTSDSSDGQGILEADQGSEEHWRHVEKLLKNVPSRSNNSEALSIERSLIQFTNVDLLDGENKFACENCYKLVQSYKAQDGTAAEDGPAEKKEEEEKEEEKEEERQDEKAETKGGASTEGKPQASNAILRRAYKRYLVSSLPSTLVLHLKRFEHTTTSFGLMKKIEDHVDIPTELDMAPFCIPKSELYDETESGVKELAIAENFANREKGGGSTKYRLYGATVHQGSLATGHYTNFVLSSKVEVPPPVITESGKPSTTTTAVSNGVGVVLPDIPLSEMLAQQNSKKKKKKGGGSGGVSAAAKKGAVGGGPNGTIAPAVGSLESVSTERPVNDKVIKTDGVVPDSTLVKDTREWIYCSDTQVRFATLDEVLASRPYILYYERC
ncbi:Ubiquitin carboxyl-terminal hydrolase 45 [Linnemannia schmuckeri]|uniref:ubiquitinyl hydrolase 1 n=1 Tax=Linnemannia schmuckeri TaxID=64567 RepID=A0A9P5S4P6_9FUNG|nr:Ubiquitin carboxyl-terminal hydrolase 45 [Linnemannia schmuckeri]